MLISLGGLAAASRAFGYDSELLAGHDYAALLKEAALSNE